MIQAEACILRKNLHNINITAINNFFKAINFNIQNTFFNSLRFAV